MTPRSALARTAGLFYLIMIVADAPAYMFSMSLDKLSPPGALAMIQASRSTFELYMVIGSAGFVAYLVLGFLLYRLFSPIGKIAASLLLMFVAVSISLGFLAVARQVDALAMIDGAHGLRLGDQLPVQVALALQGYDSIYQVACIFWGLWMFPLAWLVARSDFMPSLLAVLLALNGVFYLFDFAGPVLVPDYAHTTLGAVIGFGCGVPGTLGELLTCLWLLIMGARERRAPASATAALAA
jgi:hypothetical protein